MNYATERVDEFEYIMDSQTFDCKKAPSVVDHRWVATQNTASSLLKQQIFKGSWKLQSVSLHRDTFLFMYKICNSSVFSYLLLHKLLFLLSFLQPERCSGLEILTSGFRTTACTLSGPASTIKTTACCGPRTRSDPGTESQHELDLLASWELTRVIFGKF